MVVFSTHPSNVHTFRYRIINIQQRNVGIVCHHLICVSFLPHLHLEYTRMQFAFECQTYKYSINLLILLLFTIYI